VVIMKTEDDELACVKGDEDEETESQDADERNMEADSTDKVTHFEESDFITD